MSGDQARHLPNRTASIVGTLVFSFIVPTTVTIGIPFWLLRSQAMASVFVGPRVAGLIPILLGVGLYVWSAWGFAWIGRGTPLPAAAPQQLVIWGPYRYVRNPMYLAVLAVLAGEAILFWSIRIAIFMVFVWLLFHAFVTLYEEPRLSRRFGEPYAEYSRRVGRWIPSQADRDSK